jgi:hypothetical protein
MPSHEPWSNGPAAKSKYSYMAFPNADQTLDEVRYKTVGVRKRFRTGRCGLLFEVCRETAADLDYVCDSPVHEFHVKLEARGRCITDARREATWKSMGRRRNRGNARRRDRKPLSQELPFQFLQVCRQIYEEARLVPFTANTFEFSTAFSFISFCLADLAPDAMTALRNVVLRTTILPKNMSFHGYKQWSDILIPGFLQHLTGLRRLHLVLYYDNGFLWSAAPQSASLSDRWNKAEEFGIAGLRHLPSLLKAEVEVQFDRNTQVDDGRTKLPSNDTIKEFAEQVRKDLMRKEGVFAEASVSA